MNALRIMVAAGSLLFASSAVAQTLACGADLNGDGTGDGCTHTKYGLNPPEDRAFRFPPDGRDVSVWNRDTFAGSFYATRNADVNPFGDDCGSEKNYHPVQGQMILREVNGCVPTSEVPGAEGNGTCDDGVTACNNDFDCPGSFNGTVWEGEQCNYNLGGIGRDGGCPVEIPQDLLDDFGDPAAGLSAITSFVRTAFPGVFVILGSSRSEFGGTTEVQEIPRGGDEPVDCFSGNIHPPSIGFRYNLSVERQVALGLEAGATYIHWVDSPRQGLRRVGDGGNCCTGGTPETCTGIFPTLVQYPALSSDVCTSTSQTFHLRRTNDWVFEAGPGSAWFTDHEYAPLGQTEGVCRLAPTVPCDICDPSQYPGANCSSGPNHNLIGNLCLSDLGDDLDLPAIAPGSGPRVVDGCDFRELGPRQAVPGNTGEPQQLPIVSECGISNARLRGYPGEFCAILGHYSSPGDPSPECTLRNFGARSFPDDDCDGVVDLEIDLCPFLNEIDFFANSDEEPGGGEAGPLRGDECECGDQREDGVTNINDILDINAAIFDPSAAKPICDANNDLACNILDILEVNGEIFTPGVTSCRQVTRLSCGTGTIDAEETCDDGNISVGDGCDPGCAVEEGFSCVGEPSVCTPL